MLGGDVGTDTRVAAQRADRCIVDDRAAALALHLPEFVLHTAPHATQVDPDHAVPLFARTVGGGGDMRHNSCIVERGVDSAELGYGAVHHGRHLCVVTHVTADGDGLVTSDNQLLGFRLYCVFPEVVQQDG